MNQRKNALESLKKLQDCRYKQALLVLKTKINHLEQAKQGLLVLEQYRAEYHKPVDESLKRGLLLSRQTFLENLEVSIQEQRKMVKMAEHQFFLAQQKVKETYKSMKGLDILVEKACAQHAKQLLDKEESEQDEQLQKTQHLRKRL